MSIYDRNCWTDRVRIQGAVVIRLVERRRDGLDAVERQQRRVGEDHRQPYTQYDRCDVAPLVQRRRIVRTAYYVHEPVNNI